MAMAYPGQWHCDGHGNRHGGVRVRVGGLGPICRYGQDRRRPQRAWDQAPFARYFLNTFFIVSSILIVQFIVCTLAAYAFARFEFFGKQIFKIDKQIFFGFQVSHSLPFALFYTIFLHLF